MMIVKIKKIAQINIFKSLWVNYKIMGVRKMFKMPILIYKNTDIDMSKGSFKLTCEPSFGLVRIGLYRENLYSKKKGETKFSISGMIEIGGRALFYSGSRTIVLQGGKLFIGNDFEIGSDSSIIASKNVRIGVNCMISWDVLIMDSDLHPIYDWVGNRINAQRNICIGDNVWICCKCLVLKGVQIPGGTIVSAASIITECGASENCIVSSRKVIRENVHWSRTVIP